MKEDFEGDFIAEIISLKEEKDYVDKYNLKILKCMLNTELENKKIIGYIEKGKNYKTGDIIYVDGKISRAEEARNFYGFNQRNYLKQYKIFGVAKVEMTKYIKTKKDGYYICCMIQSSLNERFKILYKESNGKVLSKILFGLEQKIDENITSNFRDAGISHVLAISGMHITYVVIFLNFILEKIIYNIKIRNICLCIILILFLIITGNSPSCARSVIMNVLYFISKNTYRKNNVFLSICITFGILIWGNIFIIYNIGFWLSFLGTFGIVLCSPIIKVIIKRIKKEYLKKIIELTLVSVSAQIFIWPVVLYYFNTISLSFFVSNILISVLIGPIIILGYFSIIISYLILPIAKAMVVIEEILLKILILIANICSKIPFSKIYIRGTNEHILIGYYFCIAVAIYYFSKNSLLLLRLMIWIKNVIFNIILNKNEKKKCIEFIVVIIILVFIINIFAYLFDLSKFELHLVDVGQGDCTIIKIDGKNMIIDSGEGNSDKYDYGKSVVFQHLLRNGIKKLDYVVFSHMDSDHAGGLIYILENMKVGEVFLGIQPESSECLESLLKVAKEKKIKLTILESGMKVKISSNCYIDVLWPIKEDLITENALNNNSLVFKLIYKNFSILFTGDIEEIAEKKIVEKYKERLNCDILKVAHHGSKTSSIKEFLQYATPSIALIGVGKENKFAHPSDITIYNLEKIKCKIYRTDLNGETIINFKNNKIFAKTKLKND